MKTIILLIFVFNCFNFSFAAEKIIGNIGFSIGKITNQNGKELKAGDLIYFGDIIKSDNKSKSQILLLDETVITLGEETSIILDEFVYDPKTNLGKISTNIIDGSVKVLSGKISEKNPENLIVKTAAGTIGTRGTEFQTIVDEDGLSKVLLIGPGKNNTLGLRPGAVEVSNIFGTVLLDNPFSFTEFSANQIPTPPATISNEQLQEFQSFLDIRANIDSQSVETVIKEGLFDNEQITGNEIIGEIITTALNLADGGLTFDEIADVLGVSVDELLGEEYQAEINNESPENQIALANAEGGDGLAYILKYGGTNLGQTTYGDFQGITSGTYTYTGNNINMAATKGTGSGTFSGVTTVDFANKNITNTYSGTLNLAGNSDVNFSYTFNQDYSGSSASSVIEGNEAKFGINMSNGATSAEPSGGDADFDPTDYNQSGGKYYSHSETNFFNVQMNGSPNPSTGSVATIALNVSRYNNGATDTDNTIDGQRTGIMPSRN